MWILTPRGFYSVVAHWDDPLSVLVRARARADLEALAALSPDVDIEHTPDRDYAWRTTMARTEWERLVSVLAAEIDYTNFKDRVALEQGYDRATLYATVWAMLRSLQ